MWKNKWEQTGNKIGQKRGKGPEYALKHLEKDVKKPWDETCKKIGRK